MDSAPIESFDVDLDKGDFIANLIIDGKKSVRGLSTYSKGEQAILNMSLCGVI